MGLRRPGRGAGGFSLLLASGQRGQREGDAEEDATRQGDIAAARRADAAGRTILTNSVSVHRDLRNIKPDGSKKALTFALTPRATRAGRWRQGKSQRFLAPIRFDI